MKQHLTYEIIGKTRDDAVGEAFDKGAKLLGLGYPGGPLIDKLAQNGDPRFHMFPRAYLKQETYDFSYSGLKTSLLVYTQSEGQSFVRQNMNHICASYQYAAIEVLIRKTLLAAKYFKVKSVGVVGGVAANSLLRRWMSEEVHKLDIKLYLPALEYCTDNAAMIARAGSERLARGMNSSMDLNAYPTMRLGS
jgi:N6-L-threonylcarbamoyladenine synthase